MKQAKNKEPRKKRHEIVRVTAKFGPKGKLLSYTWRGGREPSEAAVLALKRSL